MKRIVLEEKDDPVMIWSLSQYMRGEPVIATTEIFQLNIMSEKKQLLLSGTSKKRMLHSAQTLTGKNKLKSSI